MKLLPLTHVVPVLAILVRLALSLSFGVATESFAQDHSTMGVVQSVARSGSLVPQSPLALSGNAWQAAAACPASVDRYAFAQDGENFYVISGVSGGPNTTNVWRYNAVTNIWTKRSNIPAASQAPAGALLNGRIYVATGDGTANAFYIYDVATDLWTAGPARPIGGATSFGAAAGAYNGKIYIVGGGSTGPTQTVSIYTIATNSWSAGPPSPSPVQLAGYTQVGQYLYVVGGFTSTVTNSTACMRFDMASNTWTSGPTFAPQRGDFGLAAAGTKLIAIGGDTTGSDFFDPSAQVDELDTTTWPSGTWVASPNNLPAVRQGNSAGFVSNGRAGGEIWSTGGATVTFINENLFRAAPICTTYTYTTSAGAIVPGTTDTGNHVDDGSTVIMLPFPYRVYDTEFTNVAVGSNGHLTFGTVNNAFDVTCLPVTAATYAIGPYWTDQCTGACTGVSGAGLGIFTSVSGAAPNRIFNIEWRTAYFNSGGGAGVPLNYEVRLYERQASFDVIYGTVNQFTPPAPRKLSTGLQKDTAEFTLQGCDVTGGQAPPVSSGQLFHYTLTNTACAAPAAPTGFLYALINNNASANQIYGFSVNESTGALSLLPGFPVASGANGNAQFPNEQLTIDTTNQRLYALNYGSSSGSASGFTINPMTGALSAMPFSPIALGSAIWGTVKVHPGGSPLLVANGTAATVRSFTITPATATEAAGSPFASFGPLSSIFSRDGAYYYVGGGGADGSRFSGFAVNSSSGVLTNLAGSPYDSGGFGAGSYATDSQGRFFCITNSGGMRIFTTASGIPTGVTGNPFPSSSGDAGLLHANEQFYFGAGRSSNTVGSYRVAGSGASSTLAAVPGSPFASGGTFTNTLAMNQTGAFLFAGNGNSRNLTKFDVNPATGILSNMVVQAADTLGTTGRISGLAYTNPASLVRTAVSRKTHGAAGVFDVNLPLTGTPGVECRNGSGASSNDHQIVVTCAAPISLSDVLIVSGTISGGNLSASANVITLNLNGVANAQRLVLEFRGVTDGVNTGNFTLQIGFLLGDTNGNGAVNASDISQVKIQSGQPVTASNFRTDVTVNGTLNASDIALVKTRSGTALP
jgi:6-phosphogluconolactonase (cycloisomerase 2 family)